MLLGLVIEVSDVATDVESHLCLSINIWYLRGVVHLFCIVGDAILHLVEGSVSTPDLICAFAVRQPNARMAARIIRIFFMFSIYFLMFIYE